MRLERRAAVYAAFAVAGMLVGLASSEPGATALGATFLVPLVYGLAARRPVLPEVRIAPARERLLEGEAVELQLTVAATERIAWLEVELPLPPRLRLLEGSECWIVALAAGERRTLRSRVEFPRWGAYRLGEARLAGWQGLFTVTASEHESPGPLVRVYPRVERLRRLVKPLATRPASGNRASGTAGEGIEFDEIREFRAGERVRRINWRASARRGELLVSDRLPERSSDVVIFLDSLAQAADDEASTLDFSVRAVAALVAAYLRQRDRVGLLSFGADLEWVLPSSSARQHYRIVEAVLASESSRLFRWRDLGLIPDRILPPQSLLVALTPMLDWRVIRALLNLRARGYDLAMIEVDPLQLAGRERARHGEEAWRVWLLERELTRSRFRRAGCRVVRWDGRTALTAAVEELASTR